MPTEAEDTRPDLDPEDIRAYLQEHPGFLLEQPDLLRRLTPPHMAGGDTIRDFQGYMVERLQADVARLSGFQSSLIAATRSNLVSQQQVHMAVLMAFDALSLEHLVHVITSDWVDILGVDAMALCMEDPFPDDTSFAHAGVQLVERGDVAALIGREGAILLRDNLSAACRDIFGPAASLVQAEALVRLAPGDGRPEGILALGSRDPDYFAPGQGTELLRFLGAMTERLLDAWFSKQTATTT